MDYQVTRFKVINDCTAPVLFDDGAQQVIDFEPVLHGEMWGPLRDLALFNQVSIDPIAHTLTWSNGADFDPETLRKIVQIGHTHPVRRISFSPDGIVLATYSKNELLFWHVWGPNRLDSVCSFASHPKLVALSYDWRFVATAESNSINVWQIESAVSGSYTNLQLRKLMEFPLSIQGPFSSMAFSPDGTTFAVGDNSLWLLDLVDDSVTELPNPDFTVGQVVFDHNGNTLGVCGGTRGPYPESMIKLYSLLR